jgi:hypothetical protein
MLDQKNYPNLEKNLSSKIRAKIKMIETFLEEKRRADDLDRKQLV